MPWVRWKWHAEIEAFPSEVMRQRHGTPNLGDITADDFIDRALTYGPLGILVAGTPCQAFSVAGLRRGLTDQRGNLTLRAVEIVDAIQPGIFLWENVPGVLSDKTNAFGSFLGALSGADAPLIPGRGQRWTRAGMVDGPKRRIAWRIQDAQYHGLAQRRERVFLVACPRNGVDPAEILLECEGVRRNTPPRREAGESVTHDVAPSLTSSGRGVERGGDSRGQDPVIACCRGYRQDGTGRGTPLVPVRTIGFYGNDAGNDAGNEISPTLRSMSGGGGNCPAIAFDTNQITSVTNRSNPQSGDPCHTLTSQAHAPAIAFNLRGREEGAQPEVSDVASLRASTGWAVRRLTPTECERLQGFPDGYAAITYRGKPAADGPRYKALGNSWAVNCGRWIGDRIRKVVQP